MRTILLVAMLNVLPSAAAAGPAPQSTVVVHLRANADLRGQAGLAKADRRRGIVEALRAHAGASQAAILTQIARWRAAGHVSRVEPLWIVNGVSVTATADAIRALAARADVAGITPDDVDVVPLAAAAEPNLSAVRAPELWGLGLTGNGVVVATLDSGVDVSHPDLASRWRGGANGWFDPYGQHATPYDRTGHGTWTAGVLVGGDAGGTSIGVAPGSRFIAARIWNDSGSASVTAIHRAFQWLLDPDGDPGTDDAPDVVNGSWSYGSPGCNLEFQPDVQALRAAGILPVFAAGNFGPAAGTSVSPANYPESLSVGAVDGQGAIAPDSSRGPSACGGATFPTVVAPGVSVRTATLYSGWTSVSGTSIAAPHVAGLVALLREAFPAATVDQVQAALVQSARDLGAAGPDVDFGNGLVDGVAARGVLASAPPPPPTAGADSFTVPGDATTDVADPGVLANDASPSGLALSAALVSGPSHGTLSLRPTGGFIYTPAAGFSGADSFGYVATDGAQQSAVVAVALTVTSTTPVAGADAYSLAENTTATVAAPGVLANDADPAGKPLSAVLVASPANGTVTLRADGGFTYAPRKNFYGTDTFTYQATNGVASSAPATVSLSVTFVNQPPVAVNDAATTKRGIAVNVAVLANDSDVDGTLVAGSVTIVTAPRNGSAARKTDGTVTYTPKRTFRGTDSFTYTVRDNDGAASNVATVTVQVN